MDELATACFLALGWRASSLLDVNAARGGLDGGDGKPEIGTSGIPLGPYVDTQRQLSIAIRIYGYE